jgi:hypothetical protein
LKFSDQSAWVRGYLAQARPKHALHDTSNNVEINIVGA